MTTYITHKELSSKLKNAIYSKSIKRTIKPIEWAGVSKPYKVKIEIPEITENTIIEIVPGKEYTEEEINAIIEMKLAPGIQEVGSFTLNSWSDEHPHNSIEIDILLRESIK